MLGQLLGDLELLDDRGPQARATPHPAHPHAPLVELVATTTDDVAVEAHEEADLVGPALPVLGREGVGRQVRHTGLDRPGDDVEQGGLAGLVALGARQSALVGPASVAVHDDRDVTGNLCRRKAWAAARRWGERRAGSSPLHHTERAHPVFEVPLEERRRQSAALPAVAQVRGVGDEPVAGEQRREQPERLGRGGRRARADGIGADGATGDDVEGAVRTLARRTSRSRGSSAPSRRSRARAGGRRRGRGWGRAPCPRANAGHRSRGGTAAAPARAPR